MSDPVIPAEPPAKAEDGKPHGGSGLMLALSAIGTIVAGALLSWSGVNAKLDQHQADITAHKIELRHIGTQVERIEGKIDEALRRKP